MLSHAWHVARRARGGQGAPSRAPSGRYPGDEAVAEAMSSRLLMSYEAESSSTYENLLRDRGARQAGEADSGEARQGAGRGGRAWTKETAVADAGDKGES